MSIEKDSGTGSHTVDDEVHTIIRTAPLCFTFF